MTQTYELGGAATPPMVNGELVFEAPWQGRAFGIARGLAEWGVYAWDDFRAALIEQIGAFDRGIDAGRLDSAVPTPQFHYYDHFLRALESILIVAGSTMPFSTSIDSSALTRSATSDGTFW